MSAHKAKRRVKATQIHYWIDPGELKRGNGGIVTPNKMFDDVSVYILPADAESYERMVEQVAKTLCNAYIKWGKCSNVWREVYRGKARAALRAIGISKPKKTKGTQ